MWQKLVKKLTSTITGGAIIIAVASILSRVTGLVRDNLFAKIIGANGISDAYNAAFKIPDFIFNILILGALSASFIPVFLEIKTKKNQEEAFRVANSVLNILLICLLFFDLLAFAFAPFLVTNILMPARSMEEQQITINLMRVMLGSIVFFGVSNVFSGILNSLRKFLAYSLAPIFYNFGIILGIIYFYAKFEAIGLAYGVVLGAALHLLIQLPAVLKTGWRYHFLINFKLEGVKKILKLMPARSLALGIAQINSIIITVLALRLEKGSLTYWTWADNLQNFPINIFGVSLALSAFPVFSQAFAEKNYAKFKEHFSVHFRRVLFLIIPVSIITLLLRAQIVRLILGSFGGGKFDWEATVMTAQVLGFFAVSMFAAATIPILARVFFAQQDTKTPVIISFCCLLINTMLAWFFSRSNGLYGLALAYSITNLLNMLLLLGILRIKMGDLEDAKIINSVCKIICASVIMGLVVHGVKYTSSQFVDMHTFIGILLQTVFSAGFGIFIYIAIAIYFKFSEVDIIRDWLKKVRLQIFGSQKKSL